MNVDSWHGCYGEGWGDRLTKASYAHPAKVSYKLAERIYQHAIAEGWVKPGDTILDPFGGIGGFAFHAEVNGLNWVGVELEQRFVDLGQANIARWNTAYGPHFPAWGSATLLRGDSLQLGAVVREAGLAAAVSSPPYEGSNQDYASGMKYIDRSKSVRKGGDYYDEASYGDTNGQLGNSAPDTFWSAARTIVSQCYDLLPAGAHCVWVVKRFVRGGKVVDFPGQWQQLCETCGFVALHEHRAWVVEDRGAQHTIFGDVEEKKVSHKSFFRMLAEAKGSPPIDFETVLCMMKQ